MKEIYISLWLAEVASLGSRSRKNRALSPNRADDLDGGFFCLILDFPYFRCFPIVGLLLGKEGGG